MKFKRLLKYIVSLALLVSIGLLFGFTNQRNQTKKVKEVDVSFMEGEQNFLTHSMVNKLLIQNQDHVKNQAKSIIDLYQLEKTVLANPFIEQASVFLSVQNVLNVRVKQREAIARVLQSDQVYYIDKQGVKFPISDNYSARVPIISGIKSEVELKEIEQFLEEINKDDFLKSEVVGIHKTSKKEFEIYVRSGNYVIQFGKCEQLKQKFFNLKAFYSKVFLEEKMKTYKTINLKYHNQVVCSK
ncbi:cell division protein FtsQ/DivIB [Flavobacteriaceae bacterium S356]|uniref:Cell division protein FtsQ/DivIB n=1 Tax=Asprobacillus argus TaxID=3076534 RepID=A0ABU3LAR6_9FLAO|nr:cell division protein FtsQ/DivIB [Flavobacteriaceae bacterium S356]